MMRGLRAFGRVWLLPTTLVCCLSDIGQEQVAAGIVRASGLLGQVQQSDQAPRTVRGTVVNSVTGEPIYRALVQLGGQYAMLTDHEGRFEFEGVTATGIPAWAMKPGYFSENRFGRIPSAAASTQTADTSIVVKLIPEAILSGTVTGQDGAPLEGIPVQLKMLSVANGMLRWRQRQGTTTDSEGRYRFAELEAGRYAVVTGFHVEGLPDAQSSLAYIPVRFPSGAIASNEGEAAAAASAGIESAITLAPGDHKDADLNPPVEKLYPVAGVITGYGETRGVSFRVETAAGEEISPASRFTARTGEFRLMLPAGSYHVTATTYLRQGSALEARRDVTVNQAPVSGFSLTMEPYATLPVEVEAQAVNQPAQGDNSATTSAQGMAANISLESAGASDFAPTYPAQPLRRQSGDDSGDSGPLAIQNVAPGRYMLRAMPQPPWYVASASCGGLDLTHEALAITGGVAGCSVRVVLRNDSGSVRVTLHDPAASDQPPGTAPQQAFISLLPVGDLIKQPTTVPLNSPQTTVAPGRYLVLALDHPVELPYRDSASMQRYAAVGQEITVTSNGSVDVEVNLVHGEP